METRRYASALLLLAGAATMLQGGLSAVSLALPEAVVLLAVFAIVLVAAWVLGGEAGILQPIITSILMLGILSLLGLVAPVLWIDNAMPVETAKFALYAVALVPIAIAIVVLMRAAVTSSRQRAVDVVALGAIFLAGALWVAAYVSARMPGPGLFWLSGSSFGQPLVIAVLTWYPSLVLAHIAVRAVARRIPARTRAAADA
jgi:hypothetical protein